MDDDIVTRLRIIHCFADDLTPCGTCLICQAADEIERLRAVRDELAERLRDRADFTDEEYPVPAAQCKCTSLRTFIGGDIYETGSRFTVADFADNIQTNLNVPVWVHLLEEK